MVASTQFIKNKLKNLMKQIYWQLRLSSNNIFGSDNKGKLRIFAYHGICKYEIADKSWLPPFYVTENQFYEQLQIIKEMGEIVHLPDILDKNGQVKIPKDKSCYIITFDDGAKNVVTLGLPIMKQLGIKSTIFVATGHIDNGVPFINDILRVLQWLNKKGDLNCTDEKVLKFIDNPMHNKQVPISQYRERILNVWNSLPADIRELVQETLGPGSWDDFRHFKNEGHWVGAHTINHIILGQEERQLRDQEIRESVTAVREKLGDFNIPFSYPNGQIGDFDELDKSILKELNIPLACACYAGSNADSTDKFELLRNAVGLEYSNLVFKAELAGLRDY